MSISISFSQFNKEKVDQVWSDIVSGKFEANAKKEKEDLEQQLPGLEEKIPKYSPEEVDFMVYSKHPKLEIYDKALGEFETVKAKAFDKKMDLLAVDELKEALKGGDKQTILHEISSMDNYLIGKFSGKQYSEYYDDYELFVNLFFAATLEMELFEQDYFKKYGLEGVPFSVWVAAFKKMDKEVVEDIKESFTSMGSSHYSFEDFRQYILPIKNVIKYCLDTNTEMVVSIEGDVSELELKRAEEIRQKFGL